MCSEQFLSRYLPLTLQKTDTEIATVLDKTITVFRYVTEKDVFERYYKGHLAKRLLQSRSVSDDAEREMLGRLKVECGYQFTQKLEGMFNDIKLSAEAMESYQTHLAKTTVSGITSLCLRGSTYALNRHPRLPSMSPL